MPDPILTVTCCACGRHIRAAMGQRRHDTAKWYCQNPLLLSTCNAEKNPYAVKPRGKVAAAPAPAASTERGDLA